MLWKRVGRKGRDFYAVDARLRYLVVYLMEAFMRVGALWYHRHVWLWGYLGMISAV